MPATHEYVDTLVIIDCPSCYITFGIMQSHQDRLRKTGRSGYCPVGHTFNYGKSEAARLREEKQRLENQVARLNDDKAFWKREAEHEGRRRAAAQGQVTKIRKRVGNGTCPCCNRHFANVARHMASQHPEYATTDEATA